MKKLKIVIILCLIAVIIGISVVLIKNSKSEETTELERYQINQYLEKLYGWQEVYGEALPTFQNVNQANKLWLWDRVKVLLISDTDEYEFSYDEINKKAKELYGENLVEEFPKQGVDYWIYDEKSNKYMATGIGLDDYEDKFIINSIVKKDKEYKVQIIEYLIDDVNSHQEIEQEEYEVYLLNLDGERINTYTNETYRYKIESFVKENKNKFSEKTVILEKQNNEFCVKSIQN